MIYIDTRTKNSMELDICNCLKISKSKLSELYNTINAIKDTEEYDLAVKNFICTCSGRYNLDEIQFYHLARRFTDFELELDGRIGYNLMDLLTGDNVLKNFLESHYINFASNGERLQLSFEGNRVSLDNMHDTNVCYLRKRLGYNDGTKDFCLNGFVFNDLLEKNDYFKQLERGPELLIYLAEYLEIQDMLEDYIKRTTYYCYEYRFPIDLVIFDGKEEMRNNEKEIYLLTSIIYRLYNYEHSGGSEMNDSDNIILRLPDDVNAEEKYYITRQTI